MDYRAATMRHLTLLLCFLLITPITFADQHDGKRQPESGDLIIPGEEQKTAEEKQCLTVCKEWGEDCVINPRTGSRKCRRTCKQFGEECF